MEREPPETEISDAPKSEEVSEREKDSVAVSPALRDDTLELIAIVGRRESMFSVRELLVSLPSLLVFPEESEKAPLATEITPLAVLLAEGVKVAV